MQQYGGRMHEIPRKTNEIREFWENADIQGDLRGAENWAGPLGF